MFNHVHLIANPTKAEGLAKALKKIHGRYAPLSLLSLTSCILLQPSITNQPCRLARADLSKNISKGVHSHRDLSTSLRFGRDDKGEGGDGPQQKFRE
jgi:hypothetical protein